jgi:hypothetical protein
MTSSAPISNGETCWLVRGRTSHSTQFPTNQCMGRVYPLPFGTYADEADFT